MVLTSDTVIMKFIMSISLYISLRSTDFLNAPREGYKSRKFLTSSHGFLYMPVIRKT